MQQKELLEFFLHPGSYAHQPGHVDLIETHASWVFLAGQFVYKVKKPVDLGFLDFSSLKKRRFYCAEEIRLNRRLAPDVYLDLVAVLRDSKGRLRLGGLEHANAIEYAVLMRRLDAQCMLDKLLQLGEVQQHTMRSVANKLVQFHASAGTGGEIDQLGSPAVIRSNHTENFEQTRPFLDQTISQARFRFIKCYSYSFIKKNRELLLSRLARGRIREGHGDLRCEHVCVESGDRVVIFDCIEFNARFRYIDVAAEVAFLAMDLEIMGHESLAAGFVRSYVQQAADSDLQVLLNFYKCYYAFARGKVYSFRLQDAGLGSKKYKQSLQSAKLCFAQSFAYACRLEEKALILLCGLSGSGKSYLAEQIAPLLGLQTISSDVLRKKLHGLQVDTPRPAGYAKDIYNAQSTALVYSRMLDQAEHLLEGGQAVLLDATFLKRKYRMDARDLALRQGCDFFVLHCSCPEQEVRNRLQTREQSTQRITNGSWQVYLRQKQEFEPISELAANQFMVLDTSRPQEENLFQVLYKIKLKADLCLQTDL